MGLNVIDEILTIELSKSLISRINKILNKQIRSGRKTEQNNTRPAIQTHRHTHIYKEKNEKI